MRSIMLLNAKGGCGKSTIVSNLASYYACEGNKVAIVDYDPQKSSLEWLAVRSEDDWEIDGIDGTDPKQSAPRGYDVVIYDVPAGVRGKDLTAMVKRFRPSSSRCYLPPSISGPPPISSMSYCWWARSHASRPSWRWWPTGYGKTPWCFTSWKNSSRA